MNKLRVPIYFTPDGVNWRRIKVDKLEECKIISKDKYKIYRF